MMVWIEGISFSVSTSRSRTVATSLYRARWRFQWRSVTPCPGDTARRSPSRGPGWSLSRCPGRSVSPQVVEEAVVALVDMEVLDMEEVVGVGDLEDSLITGRMTLVTTSI